MNKTTNNVSSSRVFRRKPNLLYDEQRHIPATIFLHKHTFYSHTCLTITDYICPIHYFYALWGANNFKTAQIPCICQNVDGTTHDILLWLYVCIPRSRTTHSETLPLRVRVGVKATLCTFTVRLKSQL